MSLYLIKANHFVYHEDLYRWQAADQHSRICAVFDDEQQAQQHWQQLEHDTITRRPLQQIEDFVNMSERRLAKLDQQVVELCGRHIIDDWQGEQILAMLTPQQAFTIIQQAGICSFTLEKIQHSEHPLYLCWSHKQQRYLTRNCDDELDSQLKPLIYHTSSERLLQCYVDDFNNLAYGALDDQEGAFEQSGSLEQISHQPQQLQQLITAHSGLRYNPDSQLLLMDYDMELLLQVYPLLKQPPLQIQAHDWYSLCRLQHEYDQQASQPIIRREQLGPFL